MTQTNDQVATLHSLLKPTLTLPDMWSCYSGNLKLKPPFCANRSHIDPAGITADAEAFA